MYEDARYSRNTIKSTVYYTCSIGISFIHSKNSWCIFNFKFLQLMYHLTTFAPEFYNFLTILL